MKLIPLTLITLGLLSACTSAEVSEPDVSDHSAGARSLEESILNYNLIRDDLYSDSMGNIYHRTIDVSAAEDPKNPEFGKVYAYRTYARLDTFMHGQATFIDLDLMDLVDTATFHKVELNDPNANYAVYEDAYTSYFMKFVSDGGTLNASRKK